MSKEKYNYIMGTQVPPKKIVVAFILTFLWILFCAVALGSTHSSQPTFRIYENISCYNVQTGINVFYNYTCDRYGDINCVHQTTTPIFQQVCQQQEVSYMNLSGNIIQGNNEYNNSLNENQISMTDFMRDYVQRKCSSLNSTSWQCGNYTVVKQ